MADEGELGQLAAAIQDLVDHSARRVPETDAGATANAGARQTPTPSDAPPDATAPGEDNE